MKRLSCAVGLSILVTFILATVFIVPASANAPVITRGAYEADWLDTGCPFPVPAHLDARFTEIYYLDKNGEPRLDSMHYAGSRLTLTYNGHVLTLRDSENSRITWITYFDAIYEIHGTSWIGNLPGHGMVTGVIGKQTLLESCQVVEEEWKCDYTLLDLSGMWFDNKEAICDYFLTGN